MKRYFDLEDFITFLKLLEEGKITKLYSECLEDGSVEEFNFLKMQFAGNEIILYDHPSGQTGIIQDTPIAPREVYEDLVMNNEYKVFIKTDNDERL